MSVLINQYIATDDGTPYVDQLADKLVSKDLSLLQFIQQLGPTITNDNPTIRVKAVELLGAVLELMQQRLLPQGVLSKQDVVVLLEFLLMKFDDKQCLEAVLIALEKLCKLPQFIPALCSSKVLTAIQSKYNPRSHLAKVRYRAFIVLQTLLDNYTNFYLGLHQNTVLFTKAFLAIAEGEKDPRNLLVSFSLNASINEHLQFDFVNDVDRLLVNDLFDVSFCYFPISFTPPPNDPYKITADQLKTQLRTTLASQPLFALEAFLLLLEKLTSTNPVIRNDVLQTVFTCVETYPTSAMNDSWLQIWNSLKFELLHRHDHLENVFKANETSLLPPDYQTVVDPTDPNKLLFYALDIIGVTFNKIEDEQRKQFFDLILEDLDPLMSKMNDKTRPAILILVHLALTNSEFTNEIALFIGKHWGKFFGSEDGGEQEVLDATRQGTFIDLIGFVLMIQSVSALERMKPYLLVYLQRLLSSTSQVRLKVIQRLLQMVLIPGLVNPTETKLIFDTVNANLTPLLVGSLVDVSQQNPLLIIEFVIPELLQRLETAGNLDEQIKVLGMLNKLCSCYQILEVLSIRYASMINRLDGKSTQLIQLIIESLIEGFIRIQKENQFLVQWSWHEKLVPDLLKASNDYMVIERISDLVGLYVNFTDKLKHAEVLKLSLRRFESFYKDASPMMLVFLKILANLDKLVEYSIDTASVLEVIAKSDDVYLRYVYCQMLALASNKFGSTITPELDQTLPYIWDLKGKLLRLDANAVNDFQKFFSKDQCTPQTLAILFEDIPIFMRLIQSIKPRDLISNVLSMNVRPLAKQRMFEIALPELLGKNDEDSLAKLASVMDRVSPELVKPHLADLVPAVITTLAQSNSSLIASGISILQILLENIELVSPHFSSIIPRLTELAVSSPVAAIRLLLLETLIAIFKNTDAQAKAMNYKDSTLDIVAQGLDDDKRKVRKACADLRQVLYEL